MTAQTRRWLIRLEYNGAPFQGWQRQHHGPSVQQSVEEAASRLNGGTPVQVVAAGRTDQGVHALGQMAHLDLKAALELHHVICGLNAHLGTGPFAGAIAVTGAFPVQGDFHARFLAIRRSYRYRILIRLEPAPLRDGFVWHYRRGRLDLAAMRQAAQRLQGRHDFTSFRASHCQAKSAVKTLDQLVVAQDGDELIITASARSFLHHQVRTMVGTLVEVGRGRLEGAAIEGILTARDRSQAGPTAPPEGLCLMDVAYPPSLV